MASLTPLLHAVIYGDSAYPSGRYTLSHGLEGMVQMGAVRGVEQAGQALLDHLRHTAAPGDGVATALAVQDADLDFLVEADYQLSATKITEALRRSSTRVGRQTLEVHSRVHSIASGSLLDRYAQAVQRKETPGNQAIALGLIHEARGLNAPEAVAVELVGLAVGWSSAALRLRQCDHIGGQAMVANAMPLIEQLVDEAVAEAQAIADSRDVSQLGRASPGLDLASAQHQFAPARLFMS